MRLGYKLTQRLLEFYEEQLNCLSEYGYLYYQHFIIGLDDYIYKISNVTERIILQDYRNEVSHYLANQKHANGGSFASADVLKRLIPYEAQPCLIKMLEFYFEITSLIPEYMS